jgi:hypothetical protein
VEEALGDCPDESDGLDDAPEAARSAAEAPEQAVTQPAASRQVNARTVRRGADDPGSVVGDGIVRRYDDVQADRAAGSGR